MNIFPSLNVVVCLEHEVQVFVRFCDVSFYCVCIYRCKHLKDLAVCYCDKVTDTGISMVVRHCSQLRKLNLRGVKDITGMCACSEYPEPTLCFITLCCMIFLQQVHH